MSNHATGPRSDAGKERSSRNAVQHGLRSERPVLPGEDAAEWDVFHAEIVQDLQPGSTLERELADRVALQLWRLRRAARYEAQVAADACDAARLAADADPFQRLRPELPAEEALCQAFQRLSILKDDLVHAERVRQTAQTLPSLAVQEYIPAAVSAELLHLIGSLLDATTAPTTAGELRQELTEATNLPAAEVLALVARRAEEAARQLANSIADWAKRIAFLRQQLAQQCQAQQHESRLLQTTALERVVRYEAHVSRQLNQALHLLRQVKEERRANEEVERREPTAAPPVETCAASSFGSLHRTAPPVAPPSDHRAPPDLPVGVVVEGVPFVRPKPPVPAARVAIGAAPPGVNGRVPRTRQDDNGGG